LDQPTNENDNVKAKMLAYYRAKRAVTVLCNHQRAIPKNHTSMMNLEGNMETKKEAIKAAEKYLEHAKKACKKDNGNSKIIPVDESKKVLERSLDQLEMMEIEGTVGDKNKNIALN
jgi:DNA topoisomerase-1